MVFLFLGFSATWDKVFSLIIGLLVIVIAFKFKPSTKTVSINNIPYVDHKTTNTPNITNNPSVSDKQNSSNITNTDFMTS